LENFDRRRIEEALSRNKYNRVNTAKELGIHVATLWRKMKKYGINV
jgi:transcriptional regulator with PAS, ATPase and Fis domain